MASADPPREPALPSEFEDRATPAVLHHDDTLAELALGRADFSGQDARGVSIRASTLDGTRLGGAALDQLELTDVLARGCDLANLAAPRADWTRVRFENCRMTGASISGGRLRDVTIRDCRVDLASFGGSRLHRVSFEDCRLTQTDFLDAELDSVCFTACDLTAADIRDARLHRCELRANRLDGLLGVERLRGVAMRWPDIVEGAELWAQALGITVLED